MKSDEMKRIDAALLCVAQVQALIKEARVRYQWVADRAAALEQDMGLADCTPQCIERLAEIKALRAELARLQDAKDRPKELLDAALASLRLANGVETVSVVTPQIGQLIAQRAAQGYSLREIAMMVGCAVPTVSLIRSGRYRYSDLPPQTKIGARGRV